MMGALDDLAVPIDLPGLSDIADRVPLDVDLASATDALASIGDAAGDVMEAGLDAVIAGASSAQTAATATARFARRRRSIALTIGVLAIATLGMVIVLRRRRSAPSATGPAPISGTTGAE